MSKEKHIIRVEKVSYEGQKRLDVRLWVWSDDQSKYVPTKRGLSVRPDQLRDVTKQIEVEGAELLQAA